MIHQVQIDDAERAEFSGQHRELLVHTVERTHRIERAVWRDAHADASADGIDHGRRHVQCELVPVFCTAAAYSMHGGRDRLPILELCLRVQAGDAGVPGAISGRRGPFAVRYAPRSACAVIRFTRSDNFSELMRARVRSTSSGNASGVGRSTSINRTTLCSSRRSVAPMRLASS